MESVTGIVQHKEDDLPMPNTYKVLFDTVIGFMKYQLENRGSILMSGFVYNKEAGMDIVDMESMPNKELAAHYMRMCALKHEATMVIHASEAYVLSKEDQDEWIKDTNPNKSMANYPSAREILMLSLDCEEGVWAGTVDIIRDGPEKRYLKEEPVMQKTLKHSGLFSNLRPPKDVIARYKAMGSPLKGMEF